MLNKGGIEKDNFASLYKSNSEPIGRCRKHILPENESNLEAITPKKLRTSNNIHYSYGNFNETYNVIIVKDEFGSIEKICMPEDTYLEINNKKFYFPNRNILEIKVVNEKDTFTIGVNKQTFNLGLFILVTGSISGLTLISAKNANSIIIQGNQINLENAYLKILTSLYIEETFSLNNAFYLNQSDLDVKGDFCSKMPILFSTQSAIKAKTFAINSHYIKEKNFNVSEKNIYFIRHARTNWSLEDLIGGPKDYSLNEIGKKEALELANFLKTTANFLSESTKIYTSPLKRCAETASIILNTLFQRTLTENDLDNGLTDINFGTLTKEQAAAVIKHGDFSDQGLYNLEHSVSLPEDREKNEHFKDRVIKFFYKVFHEVHTQKNISNLNEPEMYTNFKDILFISSGCVRWVLLSWLLGRNNNFEKDYASVEKIVNLNSIEQTGKMLYRYNSCVPTILLNSNINFENEEKLKYPFKY